MASPWIQGNGTTTALAVNPSTLAFVTQNTAAGSMLCGIVRRNSGTTVTGVTDNQSVSNVYTVVSLGTVAGVTADFFYALSTVGGSKPTISVAFSGTPAGVVITIAEYPLSSAGLLHTSITNTNTSTNPTTAAVSPSIGDLLIMAFGSAGVTTVLLTAGTCGASATLHPGGVVGATTYAAFEDGVANSSSSQTASLSYTTSSTGYATGLFAFTQGVFSISGNTGVAGATVGYTGTASGSVTADGSGNYTISNLAAGSYTVTPSLLGYTFSPINAAETITNANITGVNFTASLATAYSVPDCRQAVLGFGPGPNSYRLVNGTKIYDVQTSSNSAIPPVDSRAAGAPVACGTYPQNSRTPGTYGPGE